MGTSWFATLYTIVNMCIKCCIIAPAHDKTYDKTFAASEDSDQIRAVWSVFADRMCLLQPPDYTKRDKQEPLPYWAAVQAYLSLCW